MPRQNKKPAFEPLKNSEADLLQIVSDNFGFKSEALVNDSLWMLGNLIIEIDICNHPAFLEFQLIEKTLEELTLRTPQVLLLAESVSFDLPGNNFRKSQGCGIVKAF